MNNAELRIAANLYRYRGDDAEVVQALACKAGLSGFESHRHLQKFESGASASSATRACFERAVDIFDLLGF